MTTQTRRSSTFVPSPAPAGLGGRRPASRRGGILARLALVGGTLGILATGALAAPAATFAADIERERAGSCSAGSRWELSLERERGIIDIDLDLDTTRAGQTWTIRLKHDGTLFSRITRVSDREGEIEVDRWRANTPGEDRIKFRAVNQVTGEVCRGALSI